MSSQKQFDLSVFLEDSLSLQSNIVDPARCTKILKPDDYYEKFVLRDPYEILGEKEFKRREDVPETEIGTPIQEFYRGANVFITGATGFIGKILTEKLIRSVPHIGQIYLLIRPKRGLSPRERFDKLLEDNVFNRMKAEVPDYAARLTPVEGDLATPGLGLSTADRLTLIDRVNVVFHSAADVRFTEPLRDTVISNVHGSRRVLHLAREMKDLKAYIHVSTAYSQCVRSVIDENVPKMNINYQDILNYIESKTDEELNEDKIRLLQGWPNSYTFSKALCEDMVNEEAKDLPACIFRPSVVITTYREPVRGWTDNLNGAMGMFVGGGHGVLHCSMANHGLKLDMVPVDLVVNCMIAVAWRTADQNSNIQDSLTVYNYTQSDSAMCWNFFLKCSEDKQHIFPFNRAVWYPSYFYTESDFIYRMCWLLLHRLPGAVLDKLAELTGGKPMITKVYQKVEKLQPDLAYFGLHQWTFNNNNVMDLWRSLTEDDQKIFPFDIRETDFEEHFLVSMLGIRYYYLKEDMKTLPEALKKNKWLYWAHNSLKLTCFILSLKLGVVLAHCLPL